MHSMHMPADDVLARVLPQFFPAHWLNPPGLHFTNFPSRIRIGYVLRHEGYYEFICEAEFTELGVTPGQLHEAAIHNLSKLPSASISIAKLPDGHEGWISATDDNFAAVRILLPSVQQDFQRALGDEFLLILPCRDDCFCWSMSLPAERHEKHASQALNDFLNDDYNLTPDILKFGGAGFQLARRQTVK
jgi:hypothetical protein